MLQPETHVSTPAVRRSSQVGPPRPQMTVLGSEASRSVRSLANPPRLAAAGGAPCRLTQAVALTETAGDDVPLAVALGRSHPAPAVAS